MKRIITKINGMKQTEVIELHDKIMELCRKYNISHDTRMKISKLLIKETK